MLSLIYSTAEKVYNFVYYSIINFLIFAIPTITNYSWWNIRSKVFNTCNFSSFSLSSPFLWFKRSPCQVTVGAVLPDISGTVWAENSALGVHTMALVSELRTVVKLLKSRWWNSTFLPIPFPPFPFPLFPSPILSPNFPFPPCHPP